MALILIVDDSHDDSILIQNVLRANGYESKVASSGLEACQLMEDEKFSLILSDNQMVNGNGEWLLQHLSAMNAAPPCIIMTSDLMQNADYFHKLGAQGFCFKPINWHRLMRQIHQLLDL